MPPCHRIILIKSLHDLLFFIYKRSDISILCSKYVIISNQSGRIWIQFVWLWLKILYLLFFLLWKSWITSTSPFFLPIREDKLVIILRAVRGREGRGDHVTVIMTSFTGLTNIWIFCQSITPPACRIGKLLKETDNPTEGSGTVWFSPRSLKIYLARATTF